jgi:hypothetical protein
MTIGKNSSPHCQSDSPPSRATLASFLQGINIVGFAQTGMQLA